MKKVRIHLLLPALLLAAGCSESAPDDRTADTGRLVIRSATDARIETRARIESGAELPAADEFALQITGDDYTGAPYSGEWASIADFAASQTDFTKGRYKAVISWGDPEAEGADKPCFSGEKSFEIKARQENTVVVEARIANAQVLVRATEAFLGYFSDPQFSVKTASDNTFEFRPDASTLTEGTLSDGTSARVTVAEPVYVKAATGLTVNGSAVRQAGDRIVFPEQTLAATAPRTRHTFTFDAKNAGQITLSITLGEEYVETREIPVELNDAAIPDKE